MICAAADMHPSAAEIPRPANAQAPHPIAGTGVSLEVPQGFRTSTDFPGIGRAQDLSSVMVTELDVPLAIATDAFSPEAMARRDIEVASTTPIVVDGRQANLIAATQKIGAMRFRKWFVLLGNDTRSVLLTATTPVFVTTLVASTPVAAALPEDEVVVWRVVASCWSFGVSVTLEPEPAAATPVSIIVVVRLLVAVLWSEASATATDETWVLPIKVST